MKKIAIMGSGNGSNFQAIVRYFTGKDVEITCLSDNEDASILTRAEKLNIEHKFLPYEENFEYFSQNKFDLIVLAGYMKILPEEVLELMETVVNIHPSLLPAFRGKDAIKQAFIAGVKVSGVTVHYVDKGIDDGRIIAQYPVLITNEMHIDEFEEEIHTIEHKLYPIVIDTILEDKVFDFSDLLKGSSCSGGGCGGGGCSSCNH